jgi:polyisoprenoid-binding protein YceI
MPKIAKVLLLAVVVLALAVSVGSYSYINFIRDDTPERLTFDTSTTTSTLTTGTTGNSDTSRTTVAASLDGTWQPTSASQVGYRVKEILFGQDTEAVGRTNSVTGSLVVAGNAVTKTDLTVDLTSVRSDNGNRDNQFRTRIMDVATYPTAVYSLTKPIELRRTPDAEPQKVSASGSLTLRGVTKPVDTELQVRKNGDNVEVNGAIPITFSEWQIPNPSFGPAQTEDKGELELLVIFAKQK